MLKKLNQIKLCVGNWAAWAPGVTTAEHWHEWAVGKRLIEGDDAPSVSSMPAMHRRRVSGAGRMAMEVAYQLLGDRKDVPSIFCSRHGETTRSVEMMRTQLIGEPLSPTAFGLSVHNAVGGMFSIARADSASCIALAGGTATLANAFVEAHALLVDGAAEVLVVNYDEPLPAMLSQYADEPESAYACAWLLSKDCGEAVQLSWQATEPNSASSQSSLSASLNVLRFLISGQGNLQQQDRSTQWLWSRHDQ